MDTRLWKNEMDTKSTLKIYRNYKLEIKEEKFYNNGEASRLLFRARSNTMALNDRFRHDKGGNRRNTGCSLCGAEYENLEHFILKCDKLEGDRNRDLIRKARGADDGETLGNLLFRGGGDGIGGGYDFRNVEK